MDSTASTGGVPATREGYSPAQCEGRRCLSSSTTVRPLIVTITMSGVCTVVLTILAILEGGRPVYFGKYTTNSPADDSTSSVFIVNSGWLFVGWHESPGTPA
jgi:hypothetical protein